MRCCSRSTTWRGSLAAGLLLATMAQAAPAHAAVEDEFVRTAIRVAVERQVGAGATVLVRDLRVRLAATAAGSVFATLPADARAGAPMRVVLKVMAATGRSTRFGDADCVVDVSLPGLRTRRAIARGQRLADEDVEPVRVDAGGWVLRPLPVEVTRARAVVDLPAGQVIHRGWVVQAPLVQSGESVSLTVVAGSLRVETRGIAMQGGRLGEVIRVVNPDTGRRLPARIVGPGAVEVRHGT